MTITFKDFECYYPERMSEEEFDSLLPLASAYVCTITANRAAAAEGFKAERARCAIAAVIVEMAAQNAARGNSGARVSSVSNDGYSESYGGENSADSEERALRCAAFRYLSGTGLIGAL